MKLHAYQADAVDWVSRKLLSRKGCGLFLDMGLGKTVITLEVIALLKALGLVNRVLIVAPLRVVALGWPVEVDKWDYALTWSILHGPAKDDRLFEDTDLHLINHDGLRWLSKKTARVRQYDLIVVDESTAFKTWTSQRTKALRTVIKQTPKRIILTGTPAANGYSDLFAQMFIVDDGESLGKTVTYFRQHYQRQGGWQGRQWLLREGVESQIDEKIAPLVLRMDAREYLDMPDLVINDLFVELPPKARAEYDRLEEELFVELEAGTLNATSAGSKYSMCKGFANGGLYEYDDFAQRIGEHEVHNEKIKAVKEVRESLNGKPLIVLYQFNHDLNRLRAAFPNVPTINGKTSIKDTREAITAWEAGEIDMIFAQPMAMSHGVDRLQHGGADVVWFGLTDRNESYLQANARVYRQGNRSSQVRVHRILARDTVDEAIRERLEDKNKTQAALLNALNRYRQRRQHEPAR